MSSKNTFQEQKSTPSAYCKNTPPLSTAPNASSAGTAPTSAASASIGGHGQNATSGASATSAGEKPQAVDPASSEDHPDAEWKAAFRKNREDIEGSNADMEYCQRAREGSIPESGAAARFYNNLRDRANHHWDFRATLALHRRIRYANYTEDECKWFLHNLFMQSENGEELPNTVKPGVNAYGIRHMLFEDGLLDPTTTLRGMYEYREIQPIEAPRERWDKDAASRSKFFEIMEALSNQDDSVVSYCMTE